MGQVHNVKIPSSSRRVVPLIITKTDKSVCWSLVTLYITEVWWFLCSMVGGLCIFSLASIHFYESIKCSVHWAACPWKMCKVHSAKLLKIDAKGCMGMLHADADEESANPFPTESKAISDQHQLVNSSTVSAKVWKAVMHTDAHVSVTRNDLWRSAEKGPEIPRSRETHRMMIFSFNMQPIGSQYWCIVFFYVCFIPPFWKGGSRIMFSKRSEDLTGWSYIVLVFPMESLESFCGGSAPSIAGRRHGPAKKNVSGADTSWWQGWTSELQTKSTSNLI